MARTLPNILIIFLDQLRPFELGCYQRRPDAVTRLPEGMPRVATPHIDSLADRGVTFQCACSNNPVCTPARSVLVSGQYSRTCAGMMGNWGPPEPVRNRLVETTLPEFLAGHGYDCAHLGKWHIAVHPGLVGFANYRGTPDDPQFFPIRRDWHRVEDFRSPAWEDGLFEDFLRNRPTQPWFCFHNIHLPHAPWDLVPRDAMERYRREDVRLRPNVYLDGKMADDRKWFVKHHHEGKWGEIPDDLPVEYDLIEYHRHYYAAVTYADAQVGRALDALARSGQAEDTLVVFSADHGDNLGSHHLFNKETMNEESIRIPLIAAGPGIPTNAVNTRQLASLVDLPTTLTGLLGFEPPAHWQGRDLSGAVCDPLAEPQGENVVFIEGMQDDIAIRTPTHLYGIKMQGPWNNRPPRTVLDDAYQFFALEDDPFEMTNLAGTGAQAETAEALRARLLAWNDTTSWM